MPTAQIRRSRSTGRVRSIRWLLMAAGMIAAFTVLAPTAAASTHKDKAFHLEKVCAGFSCTVTSSTYKRIPAGTVISYSGDTPDALVATITVKHGTTTGHCDISAIFAGSGPGKCVFSTGTGSLKHFRISLVVTFDGTVWFWDGTLRHRHHCGHAHR